MKLSKELADKIEEASYNYDFEIYKDYSGRCMYGRQCWGIVSSNPIHDLMSLSLELAEDDMRLAYELQDAVRECATDSLGLDMITYFPYCEWSDEDDSEAEEA